VVLSLSRRRTHHPPGGPKPGQRRAYPAVWMVSTAAAPIRRYATPPHPTYLTPTHHRPVCSQSQTVGVP
jgi:hypothetical protein